MNDQILIKAISNLRPGAQFSFNDSDYSTIKWDKLEGKAPTEAEVLAEFTRLEAEAQTLESTRAINKAALLQRLGITSDEAALLLS
jgi:hypothetical protein